MHRALAVLRFPKNVIFDPPYYTTYCNCTVQSTVIVLCTVLYRENTEYLDLFIIVDETEFQQGQEYFFFPKIISIIRRVNNNT